MEVFQIPARTEVYLTPARELPNLQSGALMNWRKYQTKRALTFQMFVAQNSGCYFFIEDKWLIRVGKGQIKEKK